MGRATWSIYLCMLTGVACRDAVYIQDDPEMVAFELWAGVVMLSPTVTKCQTGNLREERFSSSHSRKSMAAGNSVMVGTCDKACSSRLSRFRSRRLNLKGGKARPLKTYLSDLFPPAKPPTF